MKRTWMCLTLLTLLTLLFAASAQADTLVTTADAYVRSTTATTNYGTVANVQVRYTGGAIERQSYMAFNLSGIGFTIDAATLRLYQNNTASTSVTVDVYAVASSWVETSVTWNTRPSSTGSSLGNFPTRVTADGVGWVEVTLTASAIEALRTGNNYGLMIVPRSGGSGDTIQFDSKDKAGGYPAELVVTGASNTAPVASNDSYSATEDQTLVVNAPGVLGNDTDADGDTLTAVKIANPSHGTVTLNANGSFTYTPTANYNGADSFTYQAYDGDLYSATATVNLTVAAVNDAPTAGNDSGYEVDQNGSVTISAPGVLANDTDIEGSALTAANASNPPHGSVTLNTNGSFTYTPDAGYSGSDSFTYQAYDGAAYSAAATVSITVNAVGGQTTLYATADAYVSSATATSNYGTTDNIQVRYTGSAVERQSYIQFNLSGLSTITAATLRLYQSTVIGTTVTVDVYAVAASWVETSVTWNTRPGTSGGSIGNFPTRTTAGWIDVTLTASAIEALRTGNNYGLVIIPRSGGVESTINFDSREKAAGYDAELVVTTGGGGGNIPPVANNDTYGTNLNTTLAITAPGVLGNDTDADGDPLTAIKVANPGHGTVTVNSNGSFTYTPTTGYTGADSFTYKANDGTIDGNTATVSLTITDPAAASWSMPGANSQRTGYTAEEITGSMHPRWYRPIQPYIPQNVQLVASNGNIYVATARGLYCLRASDGNVQWIYATELPLGHAPCVVDGIVYVAGFDRKIHAINATTGAAASGWPWSDTSVGAGFHTSPLVVNGKVYAGNRDGKMYCIGAEGAANERQIIWTFQTGGAINYSAAFYNNRIYFASMDCYAYCVNADTGAAVWPNGGKSARFNYVAGFQSIWPVVWAAKNKVVFCANNPNYKNAYSPGTQSVGGAGSYHEIEHTALYASRSDGYLGPTSTTTPGDWAAGTTTIDMELLVEYHQAYPWRRTALVLDLDTGAEYTFTHNSAPAYAPFGQWGTKQQTPRTAPCVGPDNVLYQVSHNRKSQSFGRGQVMGWTLGSRWLSMPNPNKHNAWDEPLAFSLGGNAIYWSLACDRETGIYRRSGSGNWQHVSYNLPSQVPGYDSMWFAVGDQDGTGNRLWGQYGSTNGIYHNHTADQNAPIAYQGKLYYHRSNCVIAWDSNTGGPTSLTRADTVTVTDSITARSVATLQAKLEAQVQAMLDAGNLRIGYFDGGQHWSRTIWGDRMEDYFSNPGQTVWALVRARPHLPSAMQTQVNTYLQNWQSSFPMQTYAHIGWNTGAKREEYDVPPEVQTSMNGMGASTSSSCNFWTFPPYTFYYLWKYCEAGLGNATTLLNAARSKLQCPVPSYCTDARLQEFAYINNAYIAGYIGYLNLQDMAGETRSTTVTNELNRLQSMRSSTFSANVPSGWTSGADNSHVNRMGVFRNWEYMVPELATYLRSTVLSTAQTAINNIDYCAPYWFVTHYEGCLQESNIQNLHDYNSVFQARAWVLQQPRATLDKFLDVPAFKVGDLYYIHQLVSMLEAP